MSKTQAEREAAARYNAKMDQIAIRVPKGTRERYKAYAESRGESLAGMIVRLVENEMAEQNQTSGEGSGKDGMQSTTHPLKGMGL